MSMGGWNGGPPPGDPNMGQQQWGQQPQQPQGGGWAPPPQQGGWPQGPMPPGGPMGFAPQVEQGSFGLGFAAGFFGGCIGLALVYIIAKGQQTKKGAGIGFAVAFVLGIIFNLAARA